MDTTIYTRSNEIGIFLRSTLKPTSYEIENNMMKLYSGALFGVTTAARKSATKKLNRYLFKAFEKVAYKNHVQHIYQQYLTIAESFNSAEGLWELYQVIRQIDGRM